MVAGIEAARVALPRHMRDYIDEADSETVIVAQIEDVEAVKNIEEIVKIEDIDCLFLGRMDLTVGYGAKTQHDDVVIEAVKHVCSVAQKAGKRIAAYSGLAEKDKLRELGVTVFTVGSEHNLIQNGISETLKAFHNFKA